MNEIRIEVDLPPLAPGRAPAPQLSPAWRERAAGAPQWEAEAVPTDIELPEIGNEPFTDAEREAIKRYCDQIAGVPDCFDLADEQGVGPLMPEEFTHDDKVNLIKGYFKMLGDWRGAITDLAEELAEAIGHGSVSVGWPAMSGAATRYVGSELFDWHKALEGWRWGTIEFFLGSDEYGYRFDTSAPRPESYRHDVDGFWING